MWNEFLKILKSKERIILGLMSGTSADGLDAALVKIKGTALSLEYELLNFKSFEYDLKVKEKILKAYDPKVSSVEYITALNFELAKIHVEYLKKLRWEYDLIAYHGQTVYHTPKKGATLQIGEADVLSVKLNKPVIHSFRTKDVALGGQGAPIVSYFDWIILNKLKIDAALNIGGIANITRVYKDKNQVIAFDTGPGNCLIDLLSKKLFDRGFDKNGEIAKKGRVLDEIISKLKKVDEKYLKKKPPKTTGREIYNMDFIKRAFDINKYNPHDIIRSVTFYTSYSINENIKMHLNDVKSIMLTGGGALNPLIIKDLKAFGYDIYIPERKFVEAKEAVAMAVLAHEFLNGKENNLPSVTGAKRYAILGKLSLP